MVSISFTRSCQLACLLLLPAVTPAVQGQSSGTIALSTSKQLAEPVPGGPQPLNSLPMTAAISPDGRYLAVVNAGYGTFESRYQQSIAVLDIQTGKVTDFPEPRTALGLPQTLYSGLAFGTDGSHLYAVFDSLTAPEGGKTVETGNAIAVYGFHDGQVKPEQLLPVPLQQLAAGKQQNQLGVALPAGTAIPSPAGIAVRKGPSGTDELLVADNLSDDVLLMDGSPARCCAGLTCRRAEWCPPPIPSQSQSTAPGVGLMWPCGTARPWRSWIWETARCSGSWNFSLPGRRLRPALIPLPLPGARTRKFFM